MEIFITLMVVGVLLILVEKMIPKGVFGLLGLVFLGTGIYVGYQTFEPEVATYILAATLGSLAVGIVLWMRFFPHSRLGKRFVHDGTVGEVDTRYHDMVGKTGVAHTPLRPSGIALIDDRRIDVQTDGTFLDRGATIKIVEAEGNRLVVEAVAEPDTEAPEPPEA